MINRTRLLADLQAQVTMVETGLHAQIGRLPEVEQRLQKEHKDAFRAKRTAASETEWIGERVMQAAVAWVLATVFVRFCEDNGLLTNPYLAGPAAGRQAHAEELHEQFMTEDAARTHRHWLLEAFADLGSGQAGKLLFDPRHNALYQIPISHDAAKVLIGFWRRREESQDGSAKLVHDFRDPDWDTRFLGDLYQDLSSEAREKYALLQTPEFVEEFILDRTLKPAIGEFGYDVVKMIDPTCGSGHFILGAFHRILKAWEDKAPSTAVDLRVPPGSRRARPARPAGLVSGPGGRRAAGQSAGAEAPRTDSVADRPGPGRTGRTGALRPLRPLRCRARRGRSTHGAGVRGAVGTGRSTVRGPHPGPCGADVRHRAARRRDARRLRCRG